MHHHEAVVGKVSEWHNGEMQEVDVAGTAVLVARVDDEFYAVGARCTHYDAPLADGALHGTRVVCPWHHACYSVMTGELQEPPALDGLPRYQVRTDGDQILVAVPTRGPDRVVPPMVARDPADERVFVVLGAGAAGVAAVEALREFGFRGRVVLITREGLPYDRTILSKDYLQERNDMGWIPMRLQQFYDEHDIEVWTGKDATRVDAAAQQIHFADGTALHYDALLLATGSTPRSLPVPGANKEGVFLLRSLYDCEQILAAMDGAQRAVVIGGSFIGMEAASVLQQGGLEVTVVAPEAVPFEQIFGAQIGQVFRTLHEENGVRFRLEQQAEQILGDGRVAAVRLQSGEQIPADLVIVGVGVQPATDLLHGVPTNKDGSVAVNEHLQVDGTNGTLWAAGDLATYPDWVSGEQIRIEHWRVAMQHGRVAAQNMAGQPATFRKVPLFWSLQHKQGFRYIGHATDWDDVLIDGDLDGRTFIAYYVKQGKLLAALGADRDRDIAMIEECLRLQHLPTAAELRRGPFDWNAWLKQAA